MPRGRKRIISEEAKAALLKTGNKEVADFISEEIEKPVTISCPLCGENAYTVKKSSLEKAMSGGELSQDDLGVISDKLKLRTGSVQLDCNMCGHELFVRNPKGGYSVYLEKGLFPNDFGSRPGIRVRNHYYMDPLGTLEAFRKSFFL